MDHLCRVLDEGDLIENLYGIGLASGPKGGLGGESGVNGQSNSLPLYQNGVGQIVLDHLLEPANAEFVSGY